MNRDLPALLVDDVSKTFRLPKEQVHTIKERVLHPFKSTEYDELKALRDVSLEVGHGEFFGIVGRNGSGKSTLLKCLAGIYARDRGDIYVNGRLSAFIELGVGFTMDLPAYDNILLNATMLGLSPKEARRRIDAVLEFAELREFADLKLKNYSSGMLVRLAFSVMIQVDADILLIDEVLAVGDAAFQQKCNEEFERIRAEGKTVLLVTHEMPTVTRFCDRAMLLERGRVVAIGDAEEVGNRYLQLNFSAEAREMERVIAEDAGREPPAQLTGQDDVVLGTGGAEISEAWFEGDDAIPQLQLKHGEPSTFCMRVTFDREVRDPLFSMAMANEQNLNLLSASTAFTDPTPGTFHAGETVVVKVRFDNILTPSRYAVTCAVTDHGGGWLQLRERMFTVMVTATREFGALVDVPHDIAIERTTSTSSSVSRT